MNEIHFDRIPLREFAQRTHREVEIKSGEKYRTLGCRLYGQGVYQRETKMGADIKAAKMFLVLENDLVINRIWAQKGSAGIVSHSLSGSVVTQDFPTFVLDNTKVLPNYIAWYLKTQDFWEECKRHSYGTSGRQRLSPKEITNVTFPLCQLDGQAKIVSKIEFMMNRTESAKRSRNLAAKELERLTVGTLRRTFSRVSCESVPLGRVCETTSGGTPSRSRSDYFEGTIPWLKSGELNDSLVTHSEERITEEALKNSSAKVFSKGTLLIALYGATVGKTGFLGMDSATNQAICGLFPQNGVLDRDYLHWFLMYKRDDFLRMSFGGAQPNISQKLLRETEIPVPSLSIQRRIVLYLSSLQEKLEKLRKLQTETGKEIGKLVTGILDRAFKGGL